MTDYPPNAPVTHEQLDERLDAEIEKRNTRWGNVRKHDVKSVTIAYVIALIGGVTAIFSVTGVATTAHDQALKANSTQCAHSKESDRARYETYREGKINSATLQRFLASEAKYRTELKPAPGCTSEVTPPPADLFPSGHVGK